jgi:pyruvate kinase
MDVARLNFSHGDHAFHRELFATVRAAAATAGRNVAILQDLQGPKLRVGKFSEGSVELVVGRKYVLHPEGSSVGKIQGMALPLVREVAGPISRDVAKGARILFDDGKMMGRVLRSVGHEIEVEIEVGGKLGSNKGINLPGTPLSLPCTSEKDIADLKFGLELGVDAIALSFVRSAKDIEDLRERIHQSSNHRPMIFAKVEREEAVDRYEEVIEVSDGILIARGDMAVELGAERVPTIQKRLIHGCAQLGVPVITATQMLESMISSPTPTRAEASDVANAVWDGTDAVMLSGETASGQYPIEAVETMARIVRGAEAEIEQFSTRPSILPLPGSVVDSVEFSAARIGAHVGANVVACLTHSGMAARTLAKYRPSTPIIAIMDREERMRQLAFVWGVHGIVIPELVATDDLFQMVERVLLDHKEVEKGDSIVVTAGVPTLRRGTTNTIKVHVVGSRVERAVPIRGDGLGATASSSSGTRAGAREKSKAKKSARSRPKPRG